MPNARSAHIEINYQGVNISKDIAPYLTSLTYSDNAGGSADDVAIELLDRDKQWLTSWRPQLSDKMSLDLLTSDWRFPGDSQKLSAGVFMVDAFQYSGRPLSASIGAKSVPADGGFTGTLRSGTWERIDLQQIAAGVCSRAGIGLVYDAPSVVMQLVEQSEQTDQEFLLGLCEKYGLAMKVYNDRLVIFSEREYEAKPAVVTISESDCVQWNAEASLNGVYTASRVVYTDPVSSATYRYQYGSGAKVLEVREKADSYADAMRIAEAQLYRTNCQAMTASLTLPGNLILVAAICVILEGFGDFDGKYFIDRAQHAIGKGFTTTLDLHKVVIL